MEDPYKSYLENNVPTITDICVKLQQRNIQTTESQVRYAIQRSNIICKDTEGNYTGTKRMLMTPFYGKSDLDVIQGNLENFSSTKINLN